MTVSENRKKLRRSWIWGITFLVVFLSLALLVYQALAQVQSLYDRAKATKQDAEEAVSLVLEKDFEGAQREAEAVYRNLHYFREFTEKEWVQKLGTMLPKYEGDFSSACRLLGMADDTMDLWLDRAFILLRTYPLDGLAAGDGFNIKGIMEYLSFVEDAVPFAEGLLSELESVELSFFDIPGAIESRREKIDEYLGLYHELEYYFPLVHAVFGDGSDRLFLLAAQNSAEMRPGGGFPGSIGTVAVKDGILTIGDFKSVWLIFPNDTPWHLMPETSVNQLFGSLLIWPRDAEFDPDFEFVGKFWADNYEYVHGVPVDGVISMTPAILQDVLGLFGSINISSGDVLDGSNTVRMLQYEWYARYMNAYEMYRYGSDNANERVDVLFRETAKGVVSVVKDNLDKDKILPLLDILEKAADERIFMMWLRGDEREALVRSYGFSGGLSQDPEEPAIGVFFGNDYAMKLGWWIDCETFVGEGRQLWDGRMEYDVTITFRNNFLYQDVAYYGRWIAGKWGNAVLNWYVYVFAPAGGSISEMYIDWWLPGMYSYYKGLQVGYRLQYYINPGTTSTVRCKVQTAPGVTVKPTVYRTPTLTKYR
ncbi:MAG: DUF4012 domain-containing protein [Firmicutes bacterium]|nr:DUF4012 domain-containing protein [Bacillota bacterium]